MRIGMALGLAAASTLATGLITAAPATAAPATTEAALVADILPGARASEPRQLTALGETLYFTAKSAGAGRELWRSDGTAGGTRLVRDIAPGAAGSAPRALTVINGRLFFSAWHPSYGWELWSSDGSTAGTTLVADLAPGPRGSDPQHLTYGVNTEASGSVPATLTYFSADDGTHGREVWRSDGTVAGTALVADVNPGAASSDPDGFAVPRGFSGTGTTVFFAADDGAHGRELWRSRGTAADTALQADINPGPSSSGPRYIMGNALFAGLFGSFPLVYLSADDGTHGREPWVSFLQGRTSIVDLRPGPLGSEPTGFNRYAFEYAQITADDGTHGREPFSLQPGSPRPDGQDSATLIADVNPGPASSSPRTPLFAYGVGRGRIRGGPAAIVGYSRDYLIATPAAEGPRLHRLDVETFGPYSQAGTHGVGGVDAAPLAASGTNPGAPVLAGSTLVYAAADSAYGRELWRSGGHTSNTRQVGDIRPGRASSDPQSLTVVGNRVFFTAADGTHGRELWAAVVGTASRVNIVGPEAPASGQPSTFTLNVFGSVATPVPTGTVTVRDGDAVVATVPLPTATAEATWTTTLSTGPHRLIATYSGDSTHAPSTSAVWLNTAS